MDKQSVMNELEAHFAGLIADDEKMTKNDLQAWAKQMLKLPILVFNP